MKRNWWTGLLIGGVVGAVTLTAGGGLYASGRGGMRGGNIACLDVVKIFNEYQRQKDLTDEMRAEQERMQSEADERRRRIDSLQATLDAMSPDDPLYAKKTREMLQLQIDYKNWADLLQADMAREIGVWTKRVYRELLGATEEIAQREGYDVVLYMSPPELLGFEPDAIKEQVRLRKVVWANPTMNITQAVLDKLNADYRAMPRTKMLQIGPLGP
jgi:Skp family chaperone for outer membrane proteins